VSTDEVYGDLGSEGYFFETTPYDPHSPYSASKASSDHLVRAYHHTYGLPVTVSNCSNNFGPYQFPEKLIPLMILNALEGQPLPVYGDGSNVRDWLYVKDHCEAIWQIVRRASIGETFNVAGGNEVKNLDLIHLLCDVVEKKFPSADNTKVKTGSYKELIKFVTDRPGHDRRYAVDFQKIRNVLNWKPAVTVAEGFDLTVQWYLDNPQWVERVRSGLYQHWLDKKGDG
jgi:dTDP-glucose 4,6-dehydratase